MALAPGRLFTVALRRGLTIMVPALLLGALYWGRNTVIIADRPTSSAAHHNSIVTRPADGRARHRCGGRPRALREQQPAHHIRRFLGSVRLDGRARFDPRTVKILLAVAPRSRSSGSLPSGAPGRRSRVINAGRSACSPCSASALRACSCTQPGASTIPGAAASTRP